MKSLSILFLATVAGLTGTVIRAQRPPDAKRTFTSPADYVSDVSATPATTSELRDLVDRFSQDRAAIQRFYTMQGSTTRRDRLRTFYDAWLAKLPAVRFDGLSLEGKVDYVLLRNRIEYERALLGREERVRRETGELVPFYDDIAQLQEDRQRLVFVGADAALASVRSVAAKVEAARARVAGGSSAPPAVAVRAAEQVDALNAALAQWFAFYNGYDPRFTAAVPGPYQSLKAALTDYAALLREKIAGLPRGAGQLATDGGGRGGRGGAAAPPTRASEGPIVGDPIGREGLLEDLRGEMIAYTPEQLIEIGNREYAWCEAEMKKASRDMGFGDDWMKALEKVKNIYVPARRTAAARPQSRARRPSRSSSSTTSSRSRRSRSDQWRMTMMPGGESAGESVLPRRRNHPGFVSDEHDVRGRHADGDARQWSALLARDRLPRADSGPLAPGVHGGALQPAASAVHDAVSDRGLGALLGIHHVGPRVSSRRPKIGSGCSSGACIAPRESSSPSTSTSDDGRRSNAWISWSTVSVTSASRPKARCVDRSTAPTRRSTRSAT